MAERPKIKRFPVQRLDQTLNLWEQRCFLLNAQARINRGLGMHDTIPIGGPVAHYAELRAHILRSSTDQKFDVTRFLSPYPSVSRLFGGIATFPYNLFQWNRFSRRVFQLSDDLQTQLENTSLDGVHWSDIKFPFDAYGMELQTPITHQVGPDCDFILVNKIQLESGEGISVTMFPAELDQVSPISKRERQTMENLLNRGRWYQANIRLLEIIKAQSWDFGFPSFHLNIETLRLPILDTESLIDKIIGEKEIETGITDVEDEARRVYWRSAAQLIVGFCLYLKQLPPHVTERSKWVTRVSTPDPTVITDEAQVCSITSIHPLTKEQLEKLRRSRGGYEMKWHWRKGYWHRRPGEGHIPDAPRVIWHPPSQIRRDRKPAGIDSIPGGARTEA